MDKIFMAAARREGSAVSSELDDAKTGDGRLGRALLGLIVPGIALVLWGCSSGVKETDEQVIVTPAREFRVRGVLKNIRADGQAAVIDHEAIPGYMEAMIMPFQVKDTNLLAGLRAGDEIDFRLSVTTEKSWIDRIERTGHTEPAVPAVESNATKDQFVQPARHPLRDFPFTNELNQVTHLSDFEGRAVGITFFFTRCPIPDYCPRLTKNFESASRKLAAMPGAPTNWHFLSVTIDPEFDTPKVLQAYGKRYNYDPKRWSFLTGPEKELRALAEQSGVTSGREGNLLNHNFRTLIIDATGRLQLSFPTGGDLSDAIVSEMIKAANAKPETPPHVLELGQ